MYANTYCLHNVVHNSTVLDRRGGGGGGVGVSRGCNIIFLNFHIQKRVQVIKGKKLNIRKMSICSVTMLKHIIITGRV